MYSRFVPTPGAVLGAESAFFLVYAGVLPPWAVGVMTAGWRFFSFYFPVILAALLLATLGAGVSGLRGASPAPNRPASG